MHDKTGYVIQISNLNQALSHGLLLKTNIKVIKFNLNAWLKLYIDMSTDPRKETKRIFEKEFFKLMNNFLLEKL